MESSLEGRSLAETPTWAVATVTTVMVFVCLAAQRSIVRCGKWLKRTRRKALLTSLIKIKEELMFLGLISLLLVQWARWISEICVDSSLFDSRFYLCSEEDYGLHQPKPIQHLIREEDAHHPNHTVASKHPSEHIVHSMPPSHSCGKGREPFVSYEGLEQLHRFLFVLGITHVVYSGVAIGLAMYKIYSWRKWESQAYILAVEMQAKRYKIMRRQSTFISHQTSHPWSRSSILIWMLCFFRQFKSSIEKADYFALRLGFVTNHKLPLSYDFHKYMVRSMEDEFHGIVGISWPLWGYAILCIFVNIHGLNIYFWLSFIPVILVMLVGTKLRHVVSLLALEIVEATGPAGTGQVKPRDDHFWFRKPEILLWLIQFISFQNAFEMATFLWSLWGLKQRDCFMKNHAMVTIRLVSGVLVQFWCSYSTVPLNVIITQMGSRCKKALVAESVRESLHSWCKRAKTRRESVHSRATRSVCSLDSTIDEQDETITLGSGTLSRSSSIASLDNIPEISNEKHETAFEITDNPTFDVSSPIPEYPSHSDDRRESDTLPFGNTDSNTSEIECRPDTLLELFKKT
ncbi:MLO-like protein 4 [Papaver somniferum]|uniref:MLO-like protein 4 n=1 Tax=Papaver somniferum TaxID=3469 RepID=UPI000E6F9BF8|nr:MLO-like protein 4 [Papaver somniferum]